MLLLSGLERVDFGGCGQSEAMGVATFLGWFGWRWTGTCLVWVSGTGSD